MTTEKYLKEIEKNDKKGKKINAFLELDKNAKAGKGKLAGKTFGIKACINVKGLHASCGSKVLEDYESPYDAEVTKRIRDEGGVIIGMCNMDEFACGGSGETSAFGATKNPTNLGLIPGGSSSGSVAAVATGFCDMALGSDTGGSIRNPASHCGVVGVKPSYGSVSRYGLIDLSMSLDQIGPIARTIEDAALLLSVIQGKDEKDSISVESKPIDLKKIKQIPKNITVGLLDLQGLNVDSKISELVENRIKESCEKYGWKIKKVKIDNLDLAVEAYYPLVYVEFFSGTRKLDGRRFGKKIEEAAGPEVLRRVLGGSEITKAEYGGRYYHKALQVKRFIEKEFEKVFKDVDCVVSPTVPRLPWKIGEKISVEEAYAADVLTIPANLAGCCAVSIPVGELPVKMPNSRSRSGSLPPTLKCGSNYSLAKSPARPSESLKICKAGMVPVGMQIMCDKFQEEKMLRIGRWVEEVVTKI